ncbi:MAG TPA: RES family NAD+ phosphorylase [Chitinophagales bacterium]|nr:RES family NAD+ phosphorylase [Chitinophagales bacterium]
MIVFRICNTTYSNDISGNGAKMYGGRWNNKGVPVLYTSSTRALAALEILVHISTNNVQPIDFSILSINLPENSIDEIPFTALKTEIDKNGLNSNFKYIGDNWIKSNSSLLLKVSSIVIPEEYNFLVNPLHKNFNKVKIVENKLFRFDKRLVMK